MIKKSQLKATKKYQDKAYFSTLVRFPKDLEMEIRTAAGESLNGYIVRAVLEKMERDKAGETQTDHPEKLQQISATDKQETTAEPAEPKETAEQAKEKRLAEYRQTMERLNYSADYIEKELKKFAETI